jgi:hypothetical protein
MYYEIGSSIVSMASGSGALQSLYVIADEAILQPFKQTMSPSEFAFEASLPLVTQKPGKFGKFHPRLV